MASWYNEPHDPYTLDTLMEREPVDCPLCEDEGYHYCLCHAHDEDEWDDQRVDMELAIAARLEEQA